VLARLPLDCAGLAEILKQLGEICLGDALLSQQRGLSSNGTENPAKAVTFNTYSF